jgi:hypothetical protein
MAQGHYFAEPLPSEAVETLFREGSPDRSLPGDHLPGENKSNAKGGENQDKALTSFAVVGVYRLA